MGPRDAGLGDRANSNAKRLHHGQVIKRDVAGNDTQGRGRHHRVVREASQSDPAEKLEVLTGVAPVEAALMTVTAGDMGLGGDMIAGLDPIDVWSNGGDGSAELMA